MVMRRERSQVGSLHSDGGPGVLATKMPVLHGLTIRGLRVWRWRRDGEERSKTQSLTDVKLDN